MESNESNAAVNAFTPNLNSYRFITLHVYTGSVKHFAAECRINKKENNTV